MREARKDLSSYAIGAQDHNTIILSFHEAPVNDKLPNSVHELMFADRIRRRCSLLAKQLVISLLRVVRDL